MIGLSSLTSITSHHITSESQDALESENQRLHECCMTLEAELLEKEEGLCQKGEELQRLEAESARNMEELRGVASHWSEKWQDVAMALQSTQAELEELREKNPGDTLQEEVVGRLKVEVERLQTQGQRDKEEIQTLHQHWASKEAELSRVIKDAGSLLKVELNACKQQLELERSRTQALHNRLKVKDNPHILGRGTVEMFDKGTETDIPPQTRDEQVSLEELGQVRAELQMVSLEEVDGAQVSQLNSELQRLELEVAEREQHLREKEHALRSLERLRDAERTEAQIKVSTLELKLINLKEQAGGEGLCHGGQEQAQHTDSLRSQLEESRRRANQLQQERDQAVQRLQTLRRLHQATEQEVAAGGKKERTVCVDNIVNQDKQRRLLEQNS
nr:oral-facial-digital syndrome 1 protein homolog [Oncorhynchus nerka]